MLATRSSHACGAWGSTIRSDPACNTRTGQAIRPARSQAACSAARMAKYQAAVRDWRMSGSWAPRDNASGFRDEYAGSIRLRKRLFGRTTDRIRASATVMGEMGTRTPNRGETSAKAETQSGNCCTNRAEIRPPMLCPTITVLREHRPPHSKIRRRSATYSEKSFTWMCSPPERPWPLKSGTSTFQPRATAERATCS